MSKLRTQTFDCPNSDALSKIVSTSKSVTVFYESGIAYTYKDVSEEHRVALAIAHTKEDSMGKFVNRVLKPNYETGTYAKELLEN